MTDDRRDGLALLITLLVAMPIEMILLNHNWAIHHGMDWFGWLSWLF